MESQMPGAQYECNGLSTSNIASKQGTTVDYIINVQGYSQTAIIHIDDRRRLVWRSLANHYSKSPREFIYKSL